MAIDERNYSIEGISEIVHAGAMALSQLSANDNASNITLTIKRIKEKIDFLEGLEKQVLSLFPAPNDRESVRAKIVEYNNTHFNNFFGADLKQTFINEFVSSAKKMKAGELKEQNLLAQYIVQEISKNLSSDIPKEEIGQKIADEFNLTISAVITENGTRVSSTKKNVISPEDGTKILVDKLTPAMRNRLREILNILNNKGSTYQFPNLQKVGLHGFQTNKNSIFIQVQSEWLTNTQGLTLTAIQENIKKDPDTWEPIVDRANKNIILMLSRNVSPGIRTYLVKYLQDLVAQDRFIFFVGKAATEVTGLLGEIAAVIAIKKLTGKEVSIDWIAHNTNDESKKVSIDVVLKGVLGINVKNTAQDFSQYKGFHNVSFVDRNPKDILETLLGKNDLNENLSDAFQTSYFNMSYIIKDTRPHVVKGSNSNFNALENRLLTFRQDLITYLYQFAPEMLYMATDDLERQLLILDDQLNKTIQGQGNILYMVGGVPFFPSEMLTDLKNDLEQLEQDLLNNNNFRNNSFFFNIGTSNSTTIISVLNERAENHESVALHGGGGKALTIQMTSSWLF